MMQKRFNLFEHYSHIYYCIYKTFIVINKRRKKEMIRSIEIEQLIDWFFSGDNKK
jgi:hypothetical protein